MRNRKGVFFLQYTSGLLTFLCEAIFSIGILKDLTPNLVDVEMNNQTNSTSLVLDNTYSEVSLKQCIITMPLLITFTIPSLIGFLLIFYYFFRLRRTLLFDCVNHHVMLCILISDFLLIATEIPLTFRYLALGYVPTQKCVSFGFFRTIPLETRLHF